MDNNKYLINNPVSIEDIDFKHINDDLPRYGTNFDYSGEKSIWCVYCHINKTNGKMYIGISSNLKDRWARNGKRYEGCDAIYNAFNKYGWDQFYHFVLMNGLTQTVASIIEQHLIIKFETFAQTEQGYNIAEGGFQTITSNHDKLRIQVHQYDLNGIYVQSFDSMTDADLCLSTNYNGCVCDAVKKQIPFAYGYLWSTTYVDQMEPFRPNDQHYCDTYHKPTVDESYYIMCLTKSGEFVRAYKNASNISENTNYIAEIRDRCNHLETNKLYHGYIWMYKKDYTPENVRKLVDKISTKSYNPFDPHQTIDVYDLDGNKIGTYENMSIAARATGADPSSIAKCCKHKIAYTHNLQFRHSSEPAPGKYDRASRRKRPTYKKLVHNIAQIDMNTNKITKLYEYAHDIETDGFNYTNVLSAIRGRYRYAYGYYWKYVDENNNIIDINIKEE